MKPFALLSLILLVGCNSYPAYRSRARDYLMQRNVSSVTIQRLVNYQPLNRDETDLLGKCYYVPVLHLLGANPGTPPDVLAVLATNTNVEIRTGVAGNRSTPLSVLLSLRSLHEYSTVNNYLARNAAIPPAILEEMHANGEADLGEFGFNENCPRSIMEEIVSRGSEIDKAGLAMNPSLPRDLMERLDKESELVRSHLRRNPNYPH